MIFAEFQAEVERRASIVFDLQTRLPLRGTSGQVSQITPVPSAGHVPVSLRGAIPVKWSWGI